MQEWDHTNYLVDLAGHYATCERVRTSGEIRVDRQTPEGDSITGFVDNIDGSASDVNAVNGYIRSLVDRWTRTRQFNSMVSQSRKTILCRRLMSNTHRRRGRDSTASDSAPVSR